MKKLILPFSVLVLALSSCGDSTDHAQTDTVSADSTVVNTNFNSPIGGFYSFGTNPETESVGSLLIYPESDSTFLFYIDFNRGAPSYNMAQLAERGFIVGDTGIYYADYPDRDESCKIKFYFKKEFVQIENSERDCGFGANCMIDRVYNRQGTDVPQYYVGPEGDTVRFSELGHELD